MIVANATGCSSIYGGNLPTTPWATNHEGCGPAWANSLFEDNAEFGLGLKLATDKKRDMALRMLKEMKEQVGYNLTDVILQNAENTETELTQQRKYVNELKRRLKEIGTEESWNFIALLNFWKENLSG